MSEETTYYGWSNAWQTKKYHRIQERHPDRGYPLDNWLYWRAKCESGTLIEGWTSDRTKVPTKLHACTRCFR